MERRIRLANSTPDVKTLLQNSSYVYTKGEGEEGDDAGIAAQFNGMSLQQPGSSDYYPPPPVAMVFTFFLLFFIADTFYRVVLGSSIHLLNQMN